MNAEEEKDKVGGSQGRLRAVSKPRDRPELHTVPGEMALAQGNFSRAIQELEKATELAFEWGRNKPGFFLGSESLVAALKKTGNVERAIQILERAGERRFQAVINNNSGAYWLKSRFELAALYPSVGREEDARAIESELRKLLVLADADHPILVALKARSAPS